MAKKEYTVLVEGVYTEIYYLEVEDDEEITVELLDRKGQHEETESFLYLGKIIDVEEVPTGPVTPIKTIKLTSASELFGGGE